MPPKRKGKAVSPVVVGTVSTRSTRRQSVVNIEIPKLSKTRTRKSLSSEEDNTAIMSDLSEKIKASYSKVVGLSDKKGTESFYDSSIIPAKSISVLPSSISTDNKELLQILEDWSDEDSQENKDFENLEFGVDEINKIIKHPVKVEIDAIVKEECETSFEDIKEIERTLSSEKDDSDSSETKENVKNELVANEDSNNSEEQEFVQDINKKKIVYESDQNSSVMFEYVTEEIIPVNEDVQLVEETSNLTLSENSCENMQIQVEVPDETNVSLPEGNEKQIYLLKGDSTSSTEFKSDQEMEVTEEVAEEIVSPPGEAMIVLQEDELEVKSNTPESTQNESIGISTNNFQKVGEDVALSDVDSNSNTQMEVMTIAITNDETLQSFSTTDSNDSEVRNYFAKEIERIETVVEKEDVQNINMSNKSSTSEENILESTSNSSDIQYKEVEPSTIKNSIQTEDANMDSEEIDVTLITKDNNRNSETIECKRNNIMSSSESKKTVFNSKNAENKVYHSYILNSKKIDDLFEDTESNEAIIGTQISDQKSEYSLVQIVAELNLKNSQEKPKKRNRKGTVKEEAAKQNTENEKLAQKTKKPPVKKKSTLNMELLDTEQMDITEKVKSRSKKNQKKEALTSNQQAAGKKLQKNKKTTEQVTDKLSNILETNTSELSNKAVKSSVPRTFKDKQTNEYIKSKKKPNPIFGSKIKIKLSPVKKKGKDNVLKSEQENRKKKEPPKKIDQQITKKMKEVPKKLDEEETKKGKEPLRKTDQEEHKKGKEPFKKMDIEDIKKIKEVKKDQPEILMKDAVDKGENESKSEAESEDVEVRRSSRIKIISGLKKKTTGHGLVRSKSEMSLNESDISDSSSIITESEKSTPLGTPSASPKTTPKERKTRWSRSVDNLASDIHPNTELVPNQDIMKMEIDEKPKLAAKDDPVVQARLKQFVHLKENVYKTSRMPCKEAKKMTCDCFLTVEEIGANEYGCGEDCLNRLLLIECSNLCQVADRCTNKRFQKGQFAPVDVFNTEKKGLGLRAAANIPYGEFILEYVGEVLNSDEFDKRAEVYSQDKNIHYYFMALRADAIIDATMKGNISRFINHSCDPNAETQKWTVNGELRIGFFSTRTILAGEEITFDYRFQRYGKEAQKCYCGASICRGWLGEEPDEESEEEYEEEEEVVVETAEISKIAELPSIEAAKPEVPPTEVLSVTKPHIPGEIEIHEEKPGVDIIKTDEKPVILPETTVTTPSIEKKIVKKKVPKKKPRVELFEEIDQLNEEIEMLVATGLKNQAHTLKLSRLMVRAQEPQQRTKLLRVLRRGELPCRRLFLDYHGLRLMHGYMIDAQHLVMTDRKFESLRLEMLQTLAVLPIPNKTLLQDSKVLPTVEKWATDKDLTSPLDSDSNSPKTDHDISMRLPKKEPKSEEPKKDENIPERSIEDQEEEIRFLASKLLEEWKNLKEVFRIPKKERIEQMKEHEREANKKFMQSGYGQEQDRDKKMNEFRYRGSSSKYKYERDNYRKSSKNSEQYSAEFMKLSKIERRKLFAIQHELKEEERRLKQRELWRQHEVNCLMIGTDPRFTAPFDPSKPYQCIWNPQLGQWQTYPLPQNTPIISPQPPLPSTSLNHPQTPKSMPNFFTPPLPPTPTLNTTIQQLSSVGIPSSVQPPLNVSHNPHINTLSSYGGLPNVSNPVLPSLTSHSQSPMHLPPSISQLNVTQLHGSLPQNLQQHGSLSQGLQQHGQLSQNLQQHVPLPQSLQQHGSLSQNLQQHGTIAQNLQQHVPLPQSLQHHGSVTPGLQQHNQLTPTNLQSANLPLAISKEHKPKEEDPSQVQFLGPIPEPVKLPPKWKCAKDKYGRPYYYHVKIRKSQWIPPPLTETPVVEEAEFSESESSSDSSSDSSGSSSENSDSDEEVDDTKLLMEVRKQMEKTSSSSKSAIPQHVKMAQTSTSTPSPEVKFSGESDMETDQDHSMVSVGGDEEVQRTSIDIRLKEQFNLKDDKPPRKKRRVGLCEEIIISPRSEEDKLQFKEDLKRYKANKEKLRRQKELIIQQTRRQLREVEQQRRAREKRSRTSVKVKIKDMPDFHSEDAKKIKETFRANMASTVVSSLNAYRKSDCKEGRITNTEDFKHLARKLTHFVMLKEMKHISKIEELLCTDNVKMKAREYIRKYMNKFGEVYIKRNDSPDFKD